MGELEGKKLSSSQSREYCGAEGQIITVSAQSFDEACCQESNRFALSYGFLISVGTNPTKSKSSKRLAHEPELNSPEPIQSEG
jgi:hypothetical protein